MELFKKVDLDSDTLQEIKKLHFQTRRLADQGITGSYRSAFRGRGIEFEQVRAYFPGDDVRSIDWNVTARTGVPHIKSYREERELTVLLAVDVSASTLTGTRAHVREALLARIGAVLTLIALRNNDKVGLVTYSNELETFHPPRKAKSAVWRILHEVMAPRSSRPGTDLAGLFRFLSKVLRHRTIVFVLSDFISEPFERELATLAKRHEVNAIRVTDPIDQRLPSSGLFRVRDAESGVEHVVDASSAEVQEAFRFRIEQANESLKSLLLRHRIPLLDIRTDANYMHDLKRFFMTRQRVSKGSGLFGR